MGWCSLQWKICLQMFEYVGKVCVAQKPNPLPYLFVVFCSVLILQSTTIDCKLTAAAAAGDKNFDKSPTKTRQPRKIDLRARYWAFLFDNLRRAVDEIYVTCESDQSVVECKVSLQLFFACCHVALTVLFLYFTKKPIGELELQRHVTFWFVFSEAL